LIGPDLRVDAPIVALVLSPLANNETSDDIVSEISSEIYSDAPGFYKKILPGVKDGDADAAYSYFLFLQHCKTAMRTQQELDFRTTSWAAYAEREGTDLDDAITAAVDLFRRCSVLDPDIDVSRESFEWLTLAADMGHMTAQLQYYRYARDELVSSLVGIREPGLLYVYKDRARAYLQNMLDTNHPEAMYRMGLAIYDGVIYEKDDILAFAYVHLAGLEGYKERGPLGLHQYLEARLTPREVSVAKKLARELCASICAD